ncbi:spermatogenesis-associated protein 17-like [Prorops nasuta]|uniref:spermatogenesis-associated protein 17-like n=1 Tax=Prorops nasuta TaxID=863751 RepID=UPI0034CFA27D
MSSTLKFMDNFKKFRKDVIELEKLAESHRLEKFIAARKIQSLFRGFITRKHIKMLHAKATIIQASWRGYVGRLFCNEFIIKRAYDMWNEHYNVMATKIQAVWRGYYSRKTKKDFIKIKKWLKDVTTKNEDMLQNMKEFRRIEIENTIQMLEQESMLKILFILFKIHHLLGTVSQPGVFTRIDKVQCTHIEKMIKCLKYRYYKVQRKKEKKPRVFIFRGTYLEKCEREIREYEDSLRAKDAPINRGIIILILSRE